MKFVRYIVILLVVMGSLFLCACGSGEVNEPSVRGIESIEKTSTEGLVDTYTITFTNGETTTFTVTNGKDGATGAQGIQGIQGIPGKDGHTPVITIENGYWHIDGVNTNVLAEGLKGDAGNGIASIKLTNTEGLIDTYTITFTNGETTTFTVTNGKDGATGAQGIQGIQGIPGKDGHTPVITIENGYWHIDGINTNVLAEGLKGETGNGISSIKLTNINGLVDTYTITFTNGQTTTFTVTNGKDGAQGIQGIQGIQGEPGKDGHTPVITIENGYWHIDGINTNVLAEGLKGETGNGISSIKLTNTEGLIDTYTITFTNGETTTFTVTNGKDGATGAQGIQGIQGIPGKDGHTPVITIENGNWHIDGVDTGKSAIGLKGETGNGISSIKLTNTEGLVDTYTITFTNGQTTTFTVTNGKDGDQGIQGIQGEPGKDGHTPVITIENGNWHIDGVDTGKSASGLKGDAGNGISSIKLTNTEGLIDTYTITFTNGETTIFTVTNGKPAAGIGKVEFDDNGNIIITLTDGTVLDPVELPKKEEHIHNFCEWIVIKDPTCTSKGVETRFCLDCNYSESRFVDELGHDEKETIKALLPTNELSGLSAEIVCDRCGETLQKQEVLDAKGYEWIIEDNEIKILMIGNSYTEDASNCGQGVQDSQMFSIIKSMVGEDIKVTLATIISGGKGINWHATQAENNKVCYTLQVITTDNPKWKSVKRVSAQDALTWTNWDMVSIQPYSVNTSTGIESNAYPNETDSKYAHLEVSTGYFLDYINTYAPQAEVYYYMHWAQTSAISLNAAKEKYLSMGQFYQNTIEYNGTLSGKRLNTIVPVGLSIQNARTTYLSLLAYNTTAYADKNLNYRTDAQIGLQRDGGHVSFNIGRYIAGMTFAEMMIPDELRSENYTIPDIRVTESLGVLPKEYTILAQQAVLASVASWKQGSYEVTVLEGYEKDPTTVYSELFDDGLKVAKITKESITEVLEELLFDDMVLEDVAINDGIVTAKVRFGYTTLSFDISKLTTDYSKLKYIAFGDSITCGIDPVIGGKVEKPYPTLVSETLSLKSYENKAVSGATIASNTPNRACLANLITSYKGEADIISVLGGVNDYYCNLPLGDIDDNDISTIYGSLHVSMSYLVENYNESFIFYMTPYKCIYSNRLYSDNNLQGYNLEDVANAIKEVAAIYNISVLDLFNEGGFENVMSNSDCDGLHPNQKFFTDVTAPQIAQFIKDNYLKVR